MSITSANVGDLSPDERHAAEMLLGRPLANSDTVVVHVLNAESNGPTLTLGTPEDGNSQAKAGKWAVPSCFNVLADLTDAERRDFDAIVSTPLSLSAKN